MANMMKEVDAVLVGVGWTGSIMARELTKAGLNVVALERGAQRMPGEDFTLPSVRDELKYPVRLELFLDTQRNRHHAACAVGDRAADAPLGSFLLGDGLGGAGTHWNGVTWRFAPSEHVLRSHLTERYGKNAIPDDMTIQDWGVTYDELEPYYDRFEKLCGISGSAGNLRGTRIDGGNVWEGPRQNEYPNKPLIMSHGRRGLQQGDERASATIRSRRRRAIRARPTPIRKGSPSAVRVLRPLRAVRLRSERQGEPQCLRAAGADGGPEIRAAHPRLCEGASLRQSGEEGAGGALYRTRTGEEYEQPAEIVVLGAYVFNNVC